MRTLYVLRVCYVYALYAGDRAEQNVGWPQEQQCQTANKQRTDNFPPTRKPEFNVKYSYSDSFRSCIWGSLKNRRCYPVE